MIAPIYTSVGKTVSLTGTAYDFGHSISAIEFSLDDGQNWTRYETPGTNDYQNLTWTFDWEPKDSGDHSPENAYVHIHVD